MLLSLLLGNVYDDVDDAKLIARLSVNGVDVQSVCKKKTELFSLL